jgi:hypothetical protein
VAHDGFANKASYELILAYILSAKILALELPFHEGGNWMFGDIIKDFVLELIWQILHNIH